MSIFDKNQEEYWVSISDIMSGLMVIFIFISIILIKDVIAIAENHKNVKNLIYKDLHSEFRDDLNKWRAKINQDNLSFRFEEPRILFEKTKSELKVEFKEILDDFFPRYIKVLEKYRKDIIEINIEGHTSSEWGNKNDPSVAYDPLVAYFKNMELSQNRAREVLEYSLMNTDISKNDIEWSKIHITANGLSSSRIVLNDKGEENKELSRRVEFRIIINTEEAINMISTEIGEGS